MSDLTTEQLAEARTKSGLSLRAVARMAGVSPSCVHSWEHGTRDPSLRNLHAWAKALGFDLTLIRKGD